MQKLLTLRRNVKALSELVKTTDERLITKPLDNRIKAEASSVIEKKQIGRPSSSSDDKRQKYCEVIIDHKTNQPRSE